MQAFQLRLLQPLSGLPQLILIESGVLGKRSIAAARATAQSLPPLQFQQLHT